MKGFVFSMDEKNQKMHKTIFHTTEKSNFILNMTYEQFNKFASYSLIIGFIILSVISCATELIACKASTIGTKGGPLWEDFENSEFIYSIFHDWRALPSFALAVVGILGASIFIIALIKQTLTKKQIIPCIAVLVMFIFMYISSLNSFSGIPDYTWFLGYRFSRYEGFMTYLSYMLIFLGGISISDKAAVKRIFDAFIIIISVQCIWSALQWIPSFPGFYHSLMYEANSNLNLPSGTTGSPIFLVSLLSVGLSIALAGSCSDKSDKRRLLYKIAIVPFAFFMIKTQTLMGLISATVITVTFFIITIISKKKKSAEFKPYVSLLLMIGGFAAALLIIFITGFKIYDGSIMWQDGFKRLYSFGEYRFKEDHPFEIDNISSLYSYLWDKAFEYIKKFPVIGVGPDGFIIPQMDPDPGLMLSGYKPDFTFDRPYNEYLFYAASFGIPFCISFVAAIVYSLVNAVKQAAKFFSQKTDWIFCAVLISIVSYIFISVINTSSPTVSPFIWLILGISCSSLKKSEEQKVHG